VIHLFLRGENDERQQQPPDMATIAISIAALAVSTFALGWNFYRDVVLKARVKVSIMISNLHDGEAIRGPYVSITVTNHGPGPVHIESIHMAKMSWLRFLGRPLLR